MNSILQIITWIAQGVALVAKTLKENPDLKTEEVVAEIEKIRLTLTDLDAIEDSEWEEVGGR